MMSDVVNEIMQSHLPPQQSKSYICNSEIKTNNDDSNDDNLSNGNQEISQYEETGSQSSSDRSDACKSNSKSSKRYRN